MYRQRLALLSISLAALSAGALADTPYLSFSAEFAFAPKAVALEVEGRKRVHSIVQLLYSHLRPELTCPEMVGLVMAGGGDAALERLQRDRLTYLKKLFAELGVAESAFFYEVAPKNATYAPKNKNVIDLEGKLNLRWSQNTFDPAKACIPVFKK